MDSSVIGVLITKGHPLIPYVFTSSPILDGTFCGWPQKIIHPRPISTLTSSELSFPGSSLDHHVFWTSLGIQSAFGDKADEFLLVIPSNNIQFKV